MKGLQVCSPASSATFSPVQFQVMMPQIRSLNDDSTSPSSSILQHFLSLRLDHNHNSSEPVATVGARYLCQFGLPYFVPIE